MRAISSVCFDWLLRPQRTLIASASRQLWIFTTTTTTALDTRILIVAWNTCGELTDIKRRPVAAGVIWTLPRRNFQDVELRHLGRRERCRVSAIFVSSICRITLGLLQLICRAAARFGRMAIIVTQYIARCHAAEISRLWGISTSAQICVEYPRTLISRWSEEQLLLNTSKMPSLTFHNLPQWKT